MIDTDGKELTEVHREYFDPESPDPVSVTVVSAIAEAIDEDPTALSPIREVVDLDHLDGLFVYGYEQSAPDETVVRFPYDDLVVGVWGDGRVSVYDRD